MGAPHRVERVHGLRWAVIALLSGVLLALAASPAMALPAFQHGGATAARCAGTCHDSQTPTNVACTACHAGGFAAAGGRHCWSCHAPGQDTTSLGSSSAACSQTCHIFTDNAADTGDACDVCHGGYYVPFSHGTTPHVGADSAPCLSCHSVSVSPTDPGASPHHSGAAPPPPSGDCASCHNGTTASLKLSHDGAATCTTCHTGMDIPPVPATCNGCHVAGDFGTGTCTSASCHGTSVIHTPTPSVPADCTACHVGKSTGHYQTLGACSKCHTEKSGYHHLGSKTIPLAQCATCHDGTIARAPVGHEGRGANCAACHIGMNIPSGSGDCASCHNGTNGSLKVGHANAACTTCHSGMDRPAVPATCNKCHAAASFGTGTCTSSSCHGTSVIHTATPSATKTCTTCHAGKEAGHYEKLGTCSKCHTNTAGYHHQGTKTIPLANCASCHDGTVAKAPIGHEGRGANCAACHTGMNIPSGGSDCASCHNGTNASLKISHATTTCTACHTGMDVPAVPATCNKCHATAQFGAESCTGASCHGTAVIHTATPSATKTCSTCHAGKATGHYEKLGTCTKCHTNVPAYHHAGAKTIPLAQCAACHDGTIAIAPIGHEGRGANCAACHTGMNIPSGGGDCASCHNGSNASLKVGHDGFTSCTVCHSGMNRPSQPVVCRQCHFRSSSGAIPTCTTCHSATGMFGREQIHTATPAAGKTCGSCHQAHYADLGACDTCHPQAPKAHHGLITVTRSRLTVAARASTITFGGSTVLQGNLTSGGVPLPFETIELQAGAYGSSSFRPVTTVTSGPDGSFLFTVSPTTNTTYRAVWKGAGTLDGARGPAMVTAGVGVRPLVAVNLTGASSRSGRYARYPLGRGVVARGDVRPNHALVGDGSTKGAVTLIAYLHRYSTRTKQWTWVKAAAVKRPLDAASRFAWSWKPRARGTYRVVAGCEPDGDHLAAQSAFRYLKVY
jgi:hypothetical protein